MQKIVIFFIKNQRTLTFLRDQPAMVIVNGIRIIISKE